MNKDPFTHQIIGHAMKTHSALGPGLDEELYHQDFRERLTKAGVEHLSKPRRDLVYRGHIADSFEADFVFENRLVAELKALRDDFAPEHFTQLFSYNKFWRIRKGLLLNFGKVSLDPKRTIYDSHTSLFPKRSMPDFVTQRDLATHLLQVAAQTLHDIGLGYRETTWIGLVTAALRAENIPFRINPAITIPARGPTSLRCLVIADTCALTITALGENVSATDRAMNQTCLRWLDLPFGIALHFGKTKADMKFVSPPRT